MQDSRDGGRDIKICQDRLDIEFVDISYSPPGKKVKNSNHEPILQNVNGRFLSGHLTAILGPSGAGKTSLFNILTGFRTSGVTGSILVNGKERDMKKFRKQSCYIPQEFALIPFLTTKETLEIAADLKLDTRFGKEKKSNLITEILELLGLDKAMNNYVSNLSGGEKKRLSIGLELLTNPPVMFFDEPISGLDSSSALQIISHLKFLAHSGRTIVCSIHQPSSRLFEMFDNVYLLSKGYCLYCGTVQNMTTILGEAGFQCPSFYNRADFAIEIATGERGDNVDNLIAKFSYREKDSSALHQNGVSEESPMLKLENGKKNASYIQIEKECNIKYNNQNFLVSDWRQFKILWKRTFICTTRDMLTSKLRFYTNIVVGLLLGAVYYNVGNDANKTFSNIACLFFFNLYLNISNAIPSVLAIPHETVVVMREHLNNWYSVRAYYFSKVFCDIPMLTICVTVFLVTGYYLTDQPLDGIRPLQFWFICLLTTLIGHSYGLMIGAFFEVPDYGIFLVPAFSIPLVLFSGFFLSLADVPNWLKWMTHISHFRYSFEASMQCIYGYNRSSLECSEPYCYFQSPRKLLNQFSVYDAVYEYDIIMLLVWFVALQVGLFCVLKWRASLLR